MAHRFVQDPGVRLDPGYGSRSTRRARGVVRGARWAAVHGMVAMALVSLAGCASNATPPAAAAAADEPVNAGLAALMRDSSIDTASLPSGPPEAMTDAQVAALVQRSALDLERVFAEQAQRRNNPSTNRTTPDASVPTQTPAIANAQPAEALAATPDSTPSQSPSFGLGDVAAAATVTPPNAETSAPDAVAATSTSPASSTAPVEPAANPALASLSAEDRVLVETASRIIDLMKPPPLADGTQLPGMNEALALAAIESAKPGTLALIDDPNGALAKGLSPERYAALRDARDRIAVNPTAAHSAAQQALTTLAPALHMSNVRLCTRVMGFGRYDAFPSTDFVVGRPIRAIVYAQIDGFTARPALNSDPVQPNVPLADQKTVDLSQSLTLFHDSGTMQAWHRPFQRVMETSRDVRQDFYLIQQIELPRLPIGDYRLKVTVRDNTTNAEHEAFIPLRVVASGATMTDAR